MKWMVPALLCLSLAACGSYDIRKALTGDTVQTLPDERPLATTLVYDCNGYEFTTRLGPGEMAVWLSDEYVVLSQVPSASGILYAEGDVTFWSKGKDAMLTAGGETYVNCHLAPERAPWEDARRRGVDFRAVGNEPGWDLEIHSTRQILFVTAYGKQRVAVPDQGEESTGTARLHHGGTAAHQLQVEIVDQPCVDTMSGATFPSQVTVTLDNVPYRGCGQNLDYPWKTEDVYP